MSKKFDKLFTERQQLLVNRLFKIEDRQIALANNLNKLIKFLGLEFYEEPRKEAEIKIRKVSKKKS